MPEKAWAYYSSAADDEITNRENHAAYHRCVHLFFSLKDGIADVHCRIWFRPRILRDMTVVDWSTTILGHKSTMPVYIVSSFSPMLLEVITIRVINSFCMPYRQQPLSENSAIQTAS